MKCPFCTSDDTRVVDSRLADNGEIVRRRRECQACNERFTTFERSELRPPQVIKSDDTREPFDEDKLRHGFSVALQKRPVDTDAVENAIHRIMRTLTSSGEREISSQRIGELVMEQLASLDEVAYIRFASVYRRFQDLDAFRHEVERLIRQPDPQAEKDQLSLLDSGDKKSK